MWWRSACSLSGALARSEDNASILLSKSLAVMAVSGILVRMSCTRMYWSMRSGTLAPYREGKSARHLPPRVHPMVVSWSMRGFSVSSHSGPVGCLPPVACLPADRFPG